MSKKLNCECKVCKKQFYAKPSHIKNRGAGKYCSNECKQLDSYVNSVCKECGKDFTHIKSQDRVYCSKECQLKALHKSNTVKEEFKECPQCRNIFKPTRVEQKFCSTECRTDAQKRQVRVKCDICNKVFLRKRSLVGRINVCTQECLREHQSNKMIGNSHSTGFKHTEETKQRLSIISTKLFKDVDYQKRWSKGLKNLPNKLETYFDSITPNEVVYTGDGKFFLTFKDGTVKNPDFVIKNSRKVIEVYGDYWHKEDDPKDLIYAYREIGFDCLVFWESEINNNTSEVIAKVQEFIKTNLIKYRINGGKKDISLSFPHF